MVSGLTAAPALGHAFTHSPAVGSDQDALATQHSRGRWRFGDPLDPCISLLNSPVTELVDQTQRLLVPEVQPTTRQRSTPRAYRVAVSHLSAYLVGYRRGDSKPDAQSREYGVEPYAPLAPGAVAASAAWLPPTVRLEIPDIEADLAPSKALDVQ